jgi:hypothetical protein
MKKLGALTVCFIAISLTNIFPEPAQKPVWEVGVEASSITYEEPGVMEQKGSMLGLFGSYTSYQNPMFRIEGRYSSGTVDYDGATQDGDPLTINNIADYILELRGMVGTELGKRALGNQENKTKLYLYGGLGYRYLNDDMSVSDGGYERESNYLYLPIGIETAHNFDNWALGATLEYDIFLIGEQISHFSDIDPGFNDLINEQTKGFGYRYSIKLHSKDEGVVIETFVRYWDIRKSDKAAITYYGKYADYGYEPKNNSMEIGFRLGLRF